MDNSAINNKEMAFIAIAFAISAATRFAASMLVPFILIPDSAWYASSAQSFIEEGQFIIGGMRNDHSLLGYSIFISLSYLVNNIDNIFITIKLLNSLIMSSALLAIFLISKKYLAKEDVKYVVVTSLAISNYFYTFTVMAESLYYPLFCWGIYLADRSIYEKKTISKILFIFVAFLAISTKITGISIIIVYSIAMLVLACDQLLQRNKVGLSVSVGFIRNNIKVLILASIGMLVLFWLILEIYNKATIRVPYFYDLGVYINSIKQLELTKLFKWIAVYIGQLNIATGFVILPSAFLLLIGRLRGQGDSNSSGIAIYLTAIIVVIGIAAFQSGYRFGRITERHFFVIIPIVLMLAFKGISVSRNRVGLFEALAGLSLFACSVAAIYLPSIVASPGFDSAAFDLLKLIELLFPDNSSAVRMVRNIYCILAVIGCIYCFANLKVFNRQNVTVFFLIVMAVYSIGCYWLTTIVADRERNRRLPIVKMIQNYISKPANIMFVYVSRDIFLDYIIWGKDYRSQITWEGRSNLTNASPIAERHLDKIARSISKEYPTYVISGRPIETMPEFIMSQYALLNEKDGIGVYHIKEFRPASASTIINLDFGDNSARRFLGDGWSKDEGPYPEIGFPTFVWAIGRHAEIALPDNNNKLDGAILSFSAKSIVNNQIITIKIDGQPFAWVDVTTTWRTYKIRLPTVPGRIGSNTLGMSFAKTARAGSGADLRELAMAFDWLTISSSK